MSQPTRQQAEALDARDPLAEMRARFDPTSVDRDGRIYLDGNSLGPLPLGVKERLIETTMGQWGGDLISSWNDHDWMLLPRTTAAKIAPLIGAGPDQVICGDSTSVNLFKTLSAAMKLRPDRSVVISEIGNFPTDLYVAEALLSSVGGELRLIDDAETELRDALAPGDVAVTMLTQVDYRTGRKLELARTTEMVRHFGALMLWDLAHSAGAFAVDLAGVDADFAVGCGYKFLNGGPGAPAYLYAATRHLDRAAPVLAGWLGHRRPFEFMPDFEPAEGVGRFTVGTPPILSFAALDEALNVFRDVAPARLTQKAQSLTELFIACVDGFASDHGLQLASPRDAARRGAQVSYRHAGGYALMQALIAAGVVGDFRAPDIVRFGFAPSYLRHVDVWDAAERLRRILADGSWRDSRDHPRRAVT